MKITTEHLTDAAAMEFRRVPPPAVNDAAISAKFTLVDGERDRNGGSLEVLHDGRVPTGEDQPSANFFFGAGTDGGRLAIDLGKVIAVQRIGSYSWHPDNRAPQVYRLYAADGNAGGFEGAPKRGTDPATCGWTLLARVDTRPADGDVGGQHAVMVADSAGNSLGRYRHLLFDISRTAEQDPFANTFFNEIDVIDANGPEPIAVTAGDAEPILRTFDAESGKYRFTIDATDRAGSRGLDGRGASAGGARVVSEARGDVTQRRVCRSHESDFALPQRYGRHARIGRRGPDQYEQ